MLASMKFTVELRETFRVCLGCWLEWGDSLYLDTGMFLLARGKHIWVSYGSPSTFVCVQNMIAADFYAGATPLSNLGFSAPPSF